jgi:hypothetical protein
MGRQEKHAGNGWFANASFKKRFGAAITCAYHRSLVFGSDIRIISRQALLRMSEPKGH